MLFRSQKPSVSNTLANHAGLIVIDAIFRQITYLEDKEIILLRGELKEMVHHLSFRVRRLKIDLMHCRTIQLGRGLKVRKDYLVLVIHIIGGGKKFI